MIKILKFKSKVSGALQGFADVEISKWGFQIFGISIFESAGKKWVGMPSQKIESKDSDKPSFLPHCRFVERETQDRFNNAVFQALDNWKQANPGWQSTPSSPQQASLFDEEIPF